MKVRLRTVKAYLRRIDYRHYICGFITAIFIAFWFRFPHALGRVLQAFKDLGTSLAYWFGEIFGLDVDITPTVNKVPSVSGSSSNDWEFFKLNWNAYWKAFIDKQNFVLYFLYVGQFFIVIAQSFFIVILALIALKQWLRRYLETHNNSYDEDSKAVRIHKRVVFGVFRPIRLWIAGFCGFVRENPRWWKAWLWLWAFYFNVITIVVEFFAFYFYFAVSFKFKAIFTQFRKLFKDLKAPLTFIPLWVWIIVAFVWFCRWRKRIARDRQYRFEARNCGFWGERSIVTLTCAAMGMGKTTMDVDGGLSELVRQRRIAFEMLLEEDLKFPYFPWVNLEKSIQRGIESHYIYNLATTRKFVQGRKAYFEKHPCKKYLFGYDFEHYNFYYDDKLRVVSVWDVIETYAQLYFIYLMESGMLANFSVRTDEILSDLGNFPRWNSDFFSRDSRLMEAYSRHAKILDLNVLRLCMKYGEELLYSDVFEFGVILITEAGKERGNAVENKGKKKDSLTANQLNDGFNNGLKMIRHSATVGGYPFVKVIMDEQRPESLGADARDLCEIIHIRGKSEKRLTMPFFFVTELVYQFVFNRFADLYYQYRYSRSDNTLPMWLLKSFTAKIEHYYKGIYNTYGYHVLDIEVERGTQDGELKQSKYYIQYKKIYSNRFSTDCFSDFFTVKALRSPVGLNDMPEYETEKASFAELQSQNSYFVNDLLMGLYNGDE